MKRIALIVGANGGVGSAAAVALVRHGWTVRAFVRDVEKARERSPLPESVEWVQGDAMKAEDVLQAARGAGVIVHAVNPPGYRNWKGLALPMLESTIAAAVATGARIVFPGTVYNFGPNAFPVVSEDSPQNPETRKGAIRVQMEERLRQASERGVRSVVLRCGDFFGPSTSVNSWFSQGLVKPGRALKSVTYPGQHDVGHAWAYLPDVGETIARILARETELPTFARFHFGGHWFERGVELAEETRKVAGIPEAPIRKFPWFAIPLLSPFVETFREMLEMRYLWSTPVRLENRKLAEFLGTEPHTPIEVALRETLIGLGCLRRDFSRRAAPVVLAEGS